MSQLPASIVPLLSSIAMNSAAQNTTTNSNPAPRATTSAASKLMLSPSQIQRNKLQNVPAFLNKLYNMVDDQTTDELIVWSPDGLSFTVIRHEEFAKKVLPRFFKHSNFSSFVRQLNMYGFHKVPHLQNGVLGTGTETERWEFSNPHFQRNQPDLLLLVTRKKGRDPEEKETGTVDLHHILDEIAAIKKHQMSISNELKNVQNDSQVLWQENMASKERHNRHQETIDKILRFLASVFSSEKNKHVGNPRKFQFLLGDTESNTESNTEKSVSDKGSSSVPTVKKRSHSIIEDVDEEADLPNKHIRKTPQFDISEFINDSTGEQRAHYSLNSPSPATADLVAAIALNNQTKKDTAVSLSSANTIHASSTSTALTNYSNTPDLSALLSLPQFQSLFNLAQTNPVLFNQLTSSTYFDSPTQSYAKSESTASPVLSYITTPNNDTVSDIETPLPTSTTADELESSLKTLASQLGFESTGDTDYVNMDDFLTNYTQASPTITTAEPPTETEK